MFPTLLLGQYFKKLKNVSDTAGGLSIEDMFDVPIFLLFFKCDVSKLLSPLQKQKIELRLVLPKKCVGYARTGDSFIV